MKIQLLDESWRIVIVVPAGSASKVGSTLESVQRNSLGTSIAVLAADDPAVRGALENCGLPVDYRLSAGLDPGSWWATILPGCIGPAGRRIFLLAGTQVPQHWDARLVAAGQRATGAVAIAPLCARHPVMSAFSDAPQNPGLGVDEIDQWLNDYSDGREFTVPVMLGSCLLLQGEFWQADLFPVATDRELLEKIRFSGKYLLATSQVFVDDSDTSYEIGVSFLPRSCQSAYLERHPLAGVRHALTQLSNRRERPPSVRRCLPVQLHVGHSWGGGLGRWMEDFIAADMRHNHLVLRSIGDLDAFGQKVALYHSADMGLPVRTWTLTEPVTAVSLGSFEYRRIIEELVADYSVESLVISSLIGHSLDLLRTGLPTTFVLHDFFPFCPALYATFGSPCNACGDKEIRACSRGNPMHSFFTFDTDEYWLAARRMFVDLLAQGEITIVAPTRSLADRYRQLAPRLQHRQIDIVPHGLDQSLLQSLAPAAPRPQAGERLKIVVLGRMTREKGAGILTAIIGQVSQFADLYLLGAGEHGNQFASLPGVSLVYSYHKNELGDLLRGVNPDLGLLLSVVPESFSYTLSELWAAGIPVLATRIGAFADRVTEARNGWLVEPEPDAVLAKLRLLHEQRHQLIQPGPCISGAEPRTAGQMAEEYAALAPVPDGVPLVRYNLPKRSYSNPHANSPQEQESQALYINHLLPYRKVLADFLHYSAGKMEQTPKVPQWLRGRLGALARSLARRLSSGESHG